MFLLSLITFTITIQYTNSHMVNLTFASSSYGAQIGSKNITITCLGEHMSRVDVVWLRYKIDNPRLVRPIFSDRKYIGKASAKYHVNIFELKNDTIRTSMTIFDIEKDDFLHAYKCECNIYKRCSNTNRARANTTLVEIPRVEVTNISFTYDNLTEFGLFSYCYEGAINTSQYFLIVISALVISGATFLLYFSSERSLNERYILIFGMIIAGLSLLVSLIIWVNAQFFGKNAYISVLIICFSLFSCGIIWILDLIFLVNFALVSGIKMVICGLYCLEIASAILLFTSNVYCTGQTKLPIDSDFDYSYLELIGGCFLLVFAIFVTLAYGTIFYTLKEKKINEKINLTRLFKVNKNFVFPSKSNGSDIRVSSLSTKNSINFDISNNVENKCPLESFKPIEGSISPTIHIDTSTAKNSINSKKSNFKLITGGVKKHQRIKSESNIAGTSKTELLDKYVRLESQYIKSLQENFTKNQHKTCFPSASTVKSNDDDNFEILKTETISCCNDNENTHISILNDTSLNNHSLNNKPNSRASNRTSSKLSTRNFKETYIFFKKPLNKFVHTKTNKKINKASPLKKNPI